MTERYDIVIVGAGMAGASLASALGPNASVLVLEAEDQPGYHATGRSVAFWTESYGGPLIQPLTTASGPFLGSHGFLSPRGALTMGRAGQEARVHAFAAGFRALGVQVDMMDRAQMVARVPGLRDDWTIAAFEPDCRDIDVAALHQHYLADMRRHGVTLRCRMSMQTARLDSAGWLIACADGSQVRADLIVNAAGAWADDVAVRAGVAPIGIAPLRRTVAQLRVSPPVPADLPLVLDIDERFYFKPGGGRLWVSPHDETPTSPCDAAPEELDVALAIDRLGDVVDWQVERIEHRWAGLRSFAPDRLPVYGLAPDQPRFFWFAGQGGFGIQTAPAAADLASRLVLGKGAGSIDPEPYSSRRFT